MHCVDLRLTHCVDPRLGLCVTLLAAVASGFKIRLHKYLTLHPEVTDIILASVSHPFVNLRCLNLDRVSTPEELGTNMHNKNNRSREKLHTTTNGSMILGKAIF